MRSSSINGKGTTEAGKVCDAAKETWLECAEEPPANTKWPEEGVKLLRGNGGGGLVKKVEETPSSIGYANLADVRSKGPGFIPPTGGEGKNMFWVEVENGEKEAVGGKKLTIYTDPSDNGEAATKSKANCAETSYVNIEPTKGKAEKGKFPPPTTEELWNRVSAEKKEVNYSLCGFTYDLGLTKYNGFKGATESEATTAGDFLEFVLDAGAGRWAAADRRRKGLHRSPHQQRSEKERPVDRPGRREKSPVLRRLVAASRDIERIGRSDRPPQGWGGLFALIVARRSWPSPPLTGRRPAGFARSFVIYKTCELLGGRRSSSGQSRPRLDFTAEFSA